MKGLTRNEQQQYNGSRLTAHGSRLTAHGSRPIYDPSHNHLSHFLKLSALVIAFCLVSFGAAFAENVTLTGSENYTANDGDVLTGSTSGTVTITDGAEITLSGASINSGIICNGNAAIILDGENTVTGKTSMAGIQVGGENTTLTIRGEGSLTAAGGDQSAGIGLSRAWNIDSYGGNIIIEGGNITAQGSKWGAGIGTGVIYGGKTARLGNITIKGGNVKASGGSEAHGIGTGYKYYNCTNETGAITIYDDIDIVDASSIGGNAAYFHGETDVTANAGEYFTITEDGDRRIITKKDDTEYSISIDGNITGGTVTADKSSAKYGEIVTLTITPDPGYMFQALTVKDSDNNDITMEMYRFVMPKSNVTAGAVFFETTASFNESTGVLTLNGNVDADEVKAYGEDSRVTSVVCEPGTVLPADCSELFIGFNMAVTVDLSNADTSNIIDTSRMFWRDGKLTTIYVNYLWSMENVADSADMFEGCEVLKGGSSTVWIGQNSSGEYAVIDGGFVKPGYLTFAKATPYVTAPEANTLTYTGESQALVTAGATNFGAMEYSLDGVNYSAEIPTGTDAGIYTVYYRVQESNNWNGAEGTVEAAINPIVVAFNANGHGTAPGSQSFTALNGKASRPDDLTAEGYTFGGWYTDADCTNAYDFDSGVTGNLTLYAKWTATTCTITYNLDGGSLPDGASNPVTYTVETESFTLANPTKDGYTFTGWTGEGLDGAIITVTIPQGSTGDMSYTATWTVNTYTVKFSANGGTGEMSSQSYTYDTAQAITGNAFTREGYTFSGWNTEADGSGSSYTDGQEVSNLAGGGEVTLYAQWRAITYTITYSGIDGATFTANNPAEYTVEDSFTLTNPTKDGYTFLGWTLDGSNDDPALTVTVDKGTKGNLAYTANWQKNAFSPKDSAIPEFAYHSLILSGQIGVIFYVYAPEGLASKDFCVYFDVSGDKSQNTQPVYAFETMTEDGKNFLGFKCYINSIQMADKIHAELHYKDTNGTERTITHDYTAKQYLTRIIDDTTQADDTRELGRAIMDFGSYVQPVLAKENGWEISKDHAEMTPANDYDDTYFTATQTATQSHALTNTLTDSSGIDEVKFALMLDSETTIILCLIPKSDYNGNVYAYVDGGNINMAVKYGDYYTVSIGNISAHELGETHNIEITTQYPDAESDSFTVNISALSYVYSAIQQDDTDMKRAVTSLYRYYHSTMTYRNNRPEIYGTN